MDLVSSIVLSTAPVGVALIGIYKLAKLFMKKEADLEHLHAQIDLKKKHQDYTLPLRLQAYERMSIFLERISPLSLMQRLGDMSLPVIQARQLLMNEIREEYSYNLSQQLYMSNEAWAAVTQGKEEMISLIIRASEGLEPEASCIELAKSIFQITVSSEKDTIGMAITVVKDEGRALL